MNLYDLTILKSRVARSGALFCILCLLFGTDGGVAYLREPVNLFRMLPGESTRLTGPMAPGATSTGQMTYESSSSSVSVSIDEIISGFWFGSKMWRGTVRLDPSVEPGRYGIEIFGAADGKRVGDNTFLVNVYRDKAALIADSRSFVLRFTGISPWFFSVAFLGFVLLCSVGLYLVASKSDALMADVGEAEVYHVTRDALGISIYFGLGERNGLEKGSRLLLMDGGRDPVEEITVESVSETDALARIGPLSNVRPGYVVKKV